MADRIIVKGWGDNKVSSIKTLRWATGAGLKEAKDAVESVSKGYGPVVLTVTDRSPLEEPGVSLEFDWEIADAIERQLVNAVQEAVAVRRYGLARDILDLMGGAS